MSEKMIKFSMWEEGIRYSYEVPQMWFVGATRSLGGYKAALQHWHDQARMEAKKLAEKQANKRPDLTPADAGELALSEQIYHHFKKHYTYSQCVFLARQFRAAGWVNLAYDPESPLTLAKGARAGVKQAIQHLQDMYKQDGYFLCPSCGGQFPNKNKTTYKDRTYVCWVCHDNAHPCCSD